LSLGISNRYTSANLSFTESSGKFFCILDKTRIAISHCCETHLSAASTIVIRGFRELLDKIVVATASLFDCKVLIDLQDATLRIRPTDLFELVGKFDIAKWLHQNKAALISSPDIDQYKQLIPWARDG